MLSLRHREDGDTIVEVLIVLTILATAFGIAYSIATKSLQGARASQEHSEALQLISSQAELLRQAAGDSTSNVFDTTAPAFCMTTSSTTAVQFTNPVPPDAASDPLTNYPAPCTQGYYHLAIIYNASAPSGAKDAFTIRVRWDGPDGHRQQEYLSYKIHKIGTF
jgi:type II secretory pathway pseudopilin PulG